MAAPASLRWSFHVAQRALGDIIRRALADGPQLIHHDTGDVVVLPLQEYERLAGTTGASLGEFLRVSPLADAETERRRFVDRAPPPSTPAAAPDLPDNAGE
ncbi:MAG TPA: hypothetical protein VH539_03215 [Gemmatimonadaceae bacterium]|jgi:hypothetical protein